MYYIRPLILFRLHEKSVSTEHSLTRVVAPLAEAGHNSQAHLLDEKLEVKANFSALAFAPDTDINILTLKKKARGKAKIQTN